MNGPSFEDRKEKDRLAIKDKKRADEMMNGLS